MLRFDPSHGLPFSLLSVLFIVSLWQLSRGLIKYTVTFLLSFFWCLSIIFTDWLMSLHQWTIFILCDVKIIANYSSFALLTHVYFSSIMAYLSDFPFPYLYCTTTSISKFWGLEVIFVWCLAQYLAWWKTSIALYYMVISNLLHDLYSYFFSWVIQHIFIYRLPGASHPARTPKVVCSLMTRRQVDMQVP